MSLILRQGDRGFGGALAWSAGLHLALFFVLSGLDLLALPKLQLQSTYYVDLTSLPTVSPGGGAAGHQPSLPPPSAPASETPAQAPLPVPSSKAPAVDRMKEAGEFEERLARLSRSADERRQEDALDALRRRLTSSGSGPAKAGGKGSDPLGGSDYGSYVQSRLRDAFVRTIASQSRNPEVVVRLTIDRNGRIIRQRFERSSGDRLFEDAVRRAIAIAEKSFPPNPVGEQYENGFLFRPEGVAAR